MADEGIIEYLERQRASFSDVSLSDVDSLVLCALAYLNFEAGMPGRTPDSRRVPLPLALGGARWDNLVATSWLEEFDGIAFLKALVESPRFMELEISGFVNDVRDDMEKQFSAITFHLPGGGAYVAIRGTDNSLAGWKENFNLSFMNEIPSHTSAREYLELAASAHPPVLYVGGHSKGGNVAEYAAFTCSDSAFEVITRVFDHDGPGFLSAPGPRYESQAYRGKLSKTVPEHSLFGMLMESRDCYRVVRGKGFGLVQHAPTNWVVSGDDFVTAEARASGSVVFANTFNQWGISLAPEQRELLFDAVFDAFRAVGIMNWAELDENRLGKAGAIAEAAVRLDPEMRDVMIDMLLKFGDTFRAETARQVRESVRIPGRA